MKKTNLYMILMASSFLAQNVYAMEEEDWGNSTTERFRSAAHTTTVHKKLDDNSDWKEKQKGKKKKKNRCSFIKTNQEREIFSDALHDNPEAQFKWGLINYNEWKKNGRSESYDEAVKFLTKASDKEHETAKALLSILEIENIETADAVDIYTQREIAEILKENASAIEEKNWDSSSQEHTRGIVNMPAVLEKSEDEDEWKEKEKGGKKFKKKEKERTKDRYEGYVDEEEVSEDNNDEPSYTASLSGPLTLLGGGQAKGKFRLISEDGKNVIFYTPTSLKVEVIGFESQDLPDISTLDPLQPLPTGIHFGSSHKKLRYSFQYEGHDYEDEVVDTFGPAYPHHAKWKAYELSLEDQEHHESRFALQLDVQLEDHSQRTALEIPKNLNHNPENTGSQLSGKLYYDGELVHLRHYREKEWELPRIQGQAHQTYRWLLKDVDKVVPTHQNSQVVFAEIIPIPGERIPASDSEYRGDYDNPSATLPFTYRKGKLASNYLIFSDGIDIFLPKITHELWQRNGWRVGFGIASYNEDSKLSFLQTAEVPNKRKLEKGIYRLFSIKEKKGKRIEKWRRLGEEFLEVKIKIPGGVSSIPGFMTHYVEPWE